MEAVGGILAVGQEAKREILARWGGFARKWSVVRRQARSGYGRYYEIVS
jgi:hypothetical protein